MKRNYLKGLLSAFAVGLMGFGASAQPNVVIIFADDLGYGDLSCYGNPTIATPHLDKMAQEGAKLTQFYVGAPVCSPSRAALLTGCYPKRVGLHVGVLSPNSKTGLNPKEETIAELLKEEGYATACFGKWHLGHHDKFMPLNQGFDQFYGFPYSNDMSRKEQLKINPNSKYKYHLPWLDQRDTIAIDPDQTNVTQKLTARALEFISGNRNNKFFLYLAYPMPHIPLYASEKFQGTSPRGLYGDVVSELDWGVGEILGLLKKKGLDDNTLVIFTSDNGPWKVFKTHGGSAGPLRGAKGTTWEGGVREPAIFRWPGHINGGQQITDVTSAMDILPTIAKLCKAPLPSRKIDGRDISSLLLSNESPEERPFIYYTKMGKLAGVREGAFKLVADGDAYYLYNVEEDISEEYDLKDKKPELYKRMMSLMHELDAEMNREAREVGRL
ncbi:arylsulfatase [Puteibacter caeruleilacunae]|nr:arylsulfatase [Puteibacter caeruleilacunae]